MIEILRGKCVTAKLAGHIVRIKLHAPDDQWGDNDMQILSGMNIIFQGPRSILASGYVYPQGLRPYVRHSEQVHTDWPSDDISLKGCKLEVEIFYGKLPVTKVEIVSSPNVLLSKDRGGIYNG